MIDKIRLQNFKGHLDTEVPLGRLTMLAGDNASGKTSVLEALWLFTSLATGSTAGFSGVYAPEDLLRRGAQSPLAITLGINGLQKLSLQRTSASANSWSISLQQETHVVFEGFLDQTHSLILPEPRKLGFSPAELLRLSSARIAASAYSNEPNVRVESDGTNTAVALATMKLGDDEAFERVEDGLRKLVPSVERIRLRRAHVERQSQTDKMVVGDKIFFDFKGANDVPAHGASQRTLISLALLTILHSHNRPNLLLLDDFDHALHPRAQMELVKTLKVLLALEEFSELQIVATTHSPYSLRGMEPSEVQVFTLRPEGTTVSKRLSQHPDALKTEGVLNAGELWSLDPEIDWVLEK